MNVRLDGKVALITGADSGIGQGIALEFARSGADVAVHYYSDQSGAEDTAAQVRALGQRALVVQADVGDYAAVGRMFEAFDAEFGQIDIMVNNAGQGGGGSTAEMDPADFDRVMKTNLYGPFYCSQQAVRRMLARDQGGRIIHITSVHEEQCGPGGVYSVSKGALRNLMRSQANELGPMGITVNGIAPGMIVTPMNGKAMADPEVEAAAAELIPVRRCGYPTDIANMATFLASDLAGYCHGSTFFVDGGWMLTYPPV
jgi:glucose 1-dehydrogenase